MSRDSLVPAHANMVAVSSRATHSEAGKWAFGLSVVAGSVVLCLLGVAWVFDRWLEAGGTDLDAPGLGLILFFFMLGGIFFTSVAFALGMAGIFDRSHKRTYALVGTVISALVLLAAWQWFVWPIIEFFVYCNYDGSSEIARCLD